METLCTSLDETQKTKNIYTVTHSIVIELVKQKQRRLGPIESSDDFELSTTFFFFLDEFGGAEFQMQKLLTEHGSMTRLFRPRKDGFDTMLRLV